MVRRAAPAAGWGAMLIAGAVSFAQADELPRLIRQLGSDQYRTRQSAQERILHFGPDAIPSLRAAAGHDDQEVRLRAALLATRLQNLRNADLIEELLAEPQQAAPLGLPCWESFVQFVGDSSAARRLYRDMLWAEPELLTALDETSPLLPAILEDRVEVLGGEVYIGHRLALEGIDPASIAVLLLATLNVETESLPALEMLLENVVLRDKLDPPVKDQDQQEATEEQRQIAAEQAADRKVLLDLIGVWVATPHAAALHLRLTKAQQFSLPSGVEPARETLRSPTAALRDRADAVLLIARFGGVEHIPDLEPLLADAAELNLHRRGRAVGSATRMQDLALAALVHLTGQEALTYGFAGVPVAPQPAYSQPMVGFASDAERAQALAQWRRWTQEHLRWPFVRGLDAIEGATL